MKTALVMKDGLNQIVLTPETDVEKQILTLLRNTRSELQILSGNFYECRGGFMREGTGNEDTILVIREKKSSEDKDVGVASHPYD